MSTVEIFGAPQSSYVRSVRMAAEFKQVPYTLVPCAPHSEEILSINPLGKIPALRHGEVMLFETSAIMAYLDMIGDGPSLQPADAMEKVQQQKWLSLIADHLYPTIVRSIVLEYIFPKGPDRTPRREEIDPALQKVKKQLPVVEEALDDNCYLIGNHLTMADLLVLPILSYLSMMPEGPNLLEPCPNIRRTLHRVAEQDWFSKTVPPKVG